MSLPVLSAPTLTLEPIIQRYFEAFNQADYATVAALFEDGGSLLPPFEAAITSPSAIGQYLAKEAAGMTAVPVESQVCPGTEGSRQVQVKGRVKTPLFTVTVQWVFTLTAADKLQSVEIKLLASLQELLQFNRG